MVQYIVFKILPLSMDVMSRLPSSPVSPSPLSEVCMAADTLRPISTPTGMGMASEDGGVDLGWACGKYRRVSYNL